MDRNNLARVFGPTIVGHGMSEPSPTTIMRDTNTQPKVLFFCRMRTFVSRRVSLNASCKRGTSHETNHFSPDRVDGFCPSCPSLLFLSQVICRMLSLPETYWRRVLAVQTDQLSSSSTVTYSQDNGHGGFSRPLTGLRPSLSLMSSHRVHVLFFVSRSLV